MSEWAIPSDGLTDCVPGQSPRGRKGKRKTKRLIIVAAKCEERQWANYREAVYPLLLKFGYFDNLRDEGAGKDSSAALPKDLRGGERAGRPTITPGLVLVVPQVTDACGEGEKITT